ncbi:MAG: zinc-binding alcohol dehydrogenase family protein [Oceanipulchritudo sp.]
MRVIRLQQPGDFQLLERPTPRPDDLKEGEVLVRVQHIGLCGTDIHAYGGRQPFFEYPRILGHELGVVVEAVNDPRSQLEEGDHCAVEAYLSAPGDRAYAIGKTNCSASTRCLGVHLDGGMVERLILPAEKCHFSSLPTDQLALVETLCIGHHAVERARLRGDETVAVIGLGPIGLGALLFARLRGVRAVALDLSAERIARARRMMPGLTGLHLEKDRPLVEQWRQTGLDHGPEVVWDCTGHAPSMENAIELADHGGTVVLVGIVKERLGFSDPDFHKRELSILSSRNATAGDFRAVINLMESGLIAPADWITHRCSLDTFPETIEKWLQTESGLLKGMIEVFPDSQPQPAFP